MNVLDKLVAGRDYLATHEHNKGVYFAVKEDGTFNRKKVCAMGAVYAALGLDLSKRLTDVYNAFSEVLPEGAPMSYRWETNDETRSIVLYNDLPETTKDDVLAMYDRAIERERELVGA